MSWTCPTCGSSNSCWSPSIFHGMRPQVQRDIALEAAALGLVNALAALAETVPGPGGARPMHPITYFEASPTKNAECQKRWEELNRYVSLVKTVMKHPMRQDLPENGFGKP